MEERATANGLSSRVSLRSLCRKGALSALLAAASTVHARPNCDDGRGRGTTVNVRFNNDMFGGMGQDQGYSNGVMISVVSPNVVDFIEDPCLPELVRGLNRWLQAIHPEGIDEQNMMFDFGQGLFTPTDRTRRDLIVDDRPYAAVLAAGVGYNARSGDRLRTTQVRLGIVGPSALGEQVQNGWHDLIGRERFEGWDNQLRDEPVFQVVHERRKRRTLHEGPGWQADRIRHWGFSLGNLSTHANAGTEWRFGYRLPDDFGSTPARPAGEGMAPGAAAPGSGWSGHLFASVDVRWVVHDITLDGNTFSHSHGVDKRPFVADIGYGVALTRGSWRFALARYHRTREFEGQHDVPVYGSFTVSRRF